MLKLLSVAISAVLALSITGCGAETNQTTKEVTSIKKAQLSEDEYFEEMTSLYIDNWWTQVRVMTSEMMAADLARLDGKNYSLSEFYRAFDLYNEASKEIMAIEPPSGIESEHNVFINKLIEHTDFYEDITQNQGTDLIEKWAEENEAEIELMDELSVQFKVIVDKLKELI